MSCGRNGAGVTLAKGPTSAGRDCLRWKGAGVLLIGGLLLAGVVLVGQMKPGSWFARVPTATARPASSAIALPTELVAHLQRWRELPALHMRAEFALEVLGVQDCVDDDCIPLEVGQVAQGSIEFWGQGDRFRIVSWIDAEALRGLRTQVAFDGMKFQMLMSNGTLSISSMTEPPKTLLPLLPNPLFELVRFRYPITDASAHLDLLFAQIQRDPLPLVSESVEWTAARLNDSDVHVVPIAGGVYEGREQYHKVYARPHDRASPVRIDRLLPGGRLLNSVEFFDYAAPDDTDSATRWPRRIVATAYDEALEPIIRINWFIFELQTPVELPEAVFTIPEHLAERVFDEQSGRFVR